MRRISELVLLFDVDKTPVIWIVFENILKNKVEMIKKLENFREFEGNGG